MKKWVAFLRGINVGGHRKVPMADLRALVADVTDDADVKSYIASGNVVFAADGDKEALTTALHGKIAETFGFDVPVLLLSAAEMGAVLSECPFPDAKGNLVYAYLCYADPAIDQTSVDALRVASESVAVRGRTVWLHAPDGVGRSKLAAKMERLTGVEVTARNLNTIRKMSEICA